jgi:hypothetical protein
LQAAHWPVHAESQHCPSTQKPLAHWAARAQVPAVCFFVHEPAAQNASAAQSGSATQELGHALPELAHAKGSQAMVAIMHAPWPSQAGTESAPAAQLVAPQGVPLAGKVQSSAAPAQPPPQLVSCPAQGARPPTGAPVTGLHTPELHDPHCDVHDEVQHVPSTQNPL